jgi:hypothetical protein
VSDELKAGLTFGVDNGWSDSFNKANKVWDMTGVTYCKGLQIVEPNTTTVLNTGDVEEAERGFLCLYNPTDIEVCIGSTVSNAFFPFGKVGEEEFACIRIDPDVEPLAFFHDGISNAQIQFMILSN